MMSSPRDHVALDRIISLSESAERLGVSISNIQRMRARGEIKVLQISPRRVGVRVSELVRVQNSLKEASINPHAPNSSEITRAA